MQKHILNLANPEDAKATFNFKVSKFPDGQQNIELIPKGSDTFENIKDRAMDSIVEIKARLSSFLDLEIILAATAELRDLGYERIELYIPYCIGGRSDEKFNEGQPHYIRNVIAPILNAQGYRKVTILDPHSGVLKGCIHKVEPIDNSGVVEFAFRDYMNENGYGQLTVNKFLQNPPFYVLSPDAGSNKKIYGLSVALGYKGEVVRCDKLRDHAGKIIESIVYKDDFGGKDAFLIDDICDGGRTFNELVKIIKQRNVGRIYLVITHGIFSAGFVELNKHFDGIYCTNSVVDMNNPQFSLLNDNKLHKLKQLNVF